MTCRPFFYGNRINTFWNYYVIVNLAGILCHSDKTIFQDCSAYWSLRLSSSATASSQVFCILLTEVPCQYRELRANLNERWSVAFFERYARQIHYVWEWSKKFWNSNTISMLITLFAYFLHKREKNNNLEQKSSSNDLYAYGW